MGSGTTKLQIRQTQPAIVVKTASKPGDVLLGETLSNPHSPDETAILNALDAVFG
jgi:hypothetical protein